MGTLFSILLLGGLIVFAISGAVVLPALLVISMVIFSLWVVGFILVSIFRLIGWLVFSLGALIFGIVGAALAVMLVGGGVVIAFGLLLMPFVLPLVLIVALVSWLVRAHKKPTPMPPTAPIA